MESGTLTRAERDDLLRRHEALWAEYVTAAADETTAYEDERAMQLELERLLGLYFDGLPRLPLSRCPFCEEVYLHSFDPWGVDGYWWQEGAAKETTEPPPCPHFGVLQGAVSLNGRAPRGAPREESYLGPGVPFVIPRVLEQPGVVAVVSSLEMDNGYTAYPVAYFSGEPLPRAAFTQPWTRTSFSWPDGRGGWSWRVDTDPWDFDLAAWVERDRVLWIEPGDDALRLRTRRQGDCPYVDVEGVRERQYVQGDQLRTVPPPQGETVDPFAE